MVIQWCLPPRRGVLPSTGSNKNMRLISAFSSSCFTSFTLILQEMIKRARDTQREITHEESTRRKSTATSSSSSRSVQKTQKWSEGLISAAKDIGAGAKLLVDSANHLVQSEGQGAKFEELIAASQEIAGCTAQVYPAH